MAHMAVCRGCQTRAGLPTLPSDSTKVVGEPSGWLSVQYTLNSRVKCARYCPACTSPILVLLKEKNE